MKINLSVFEQMGWNDREARAQQKRDALDAQIEQTQIKQTHETERFKINALVTCVVVVVVGVIAVLIWGS